MCEKTCLDVGDEQFLVLLFVVQADCEDRLHFIEQFVIRAFQQFLNVRVDRLPEAIGFGDRRTRDQPAEVAPVHVARGIVVGVKKIGVLRNHRAVARHPNLQNEGLKKPAGVREMPFRRADVRHRLHDVIFRFERLTEAFGKIADLAKTSEQSGGATFLRSAVDRVSQLVQ